MSDRETCCTDKVLLALHARVLFVARRCPCGIRLQSLAISRAEMLVRLLPDPTNHGFAYTMVMRQGLRCSIAA